MTVKEFMDLKKNKVVFFTEEMRLWWRGVIAVKEMGGEWNALMESQVLVVKPMPPSDWCSQTLILFHC